MKGGQTPIHIMRWAPGDFENDPFVMLMKKRRAYRVLTFYTSFLFRSHMEGGSLPADIDLLAAALQLDSRTTAAGYTVCKQHAKVVEADGRLYHKRVARDVAKELSYREKQAEAGNKGGRPKKGTLSDPKSPPSPSSTPTSSSAPTPTPAPVRARSPDVDRHGVPGEAEAVRAQISVLLAEESKVSGRPEDELLVEASDTGNGAIVSVDSDVSVSWLKVARDKLTAMRLRRQAKSRPPPVAQPSAAALAREQSSVAGIRGGLRERQGMDHGVQPARGDDAGPGADASDGGGSRGLLPPSPEPSER